VADIIDTCGQIAVTILARSSFAPSPSLSRITMSNDSFQRIWNEAIRNYQSLTGTDITGEVNDIGDIDTADDLLRRIDQAQERFKLYRKRGEKIRRVLEPLLVLIRAFSDTIGNAVGMVCIAIQTKLLVTKMILLGVLSCKGYFCSHTSNV
jgi:hypothetical protein